MTPRLGYYAHHQGQGHVQRAASIAPHLRHVPTLLTSVAYRRWPGEKVTLPLDVPATDRRVSPAHVPLPDILHYAPVGAAGLRRRMALIADWFARSDPSVLVVDVSVEVTLLARMSGVAPVVVRQGGVRTDPAHRAAYDSAVLLLAPWPECMEDPTASAEVRDRTFYAGGFSRFDGRVLSRAAARRTVGFSEDRSHVVALHGAGGDSFDLAGLRAAATATPGWQWTVVGGSVRGGQPGSEPEGQPGLLDLRGWVDDPFALLRAADVVVTHAGTNALFEAAAARAPLVVIPAPRPFDEQVRQAQRVRELDAASVFTRWPEPAKWPAVLEEASRRDTTVLAQLNDAKGARRAAERLDQIADEVGA